MIRERNYIDNTNDSPKHILLGNSNDKRKKFS